MKIPKNGAYFRLSEEIRVTLEVMQEMTGVTMTEILESCIRIGKKTVAKSRGLNYQFLLDKIKEKRAVLQARRNHIIEGDGVTIEELEDELPFDPKNDINLKDTIAIAKTKWLED